MKDKLEETVHLFKTPGLINPKHYVLTDITFNTNMVLIFSDINEGQIYKMRYKDNPHFEIEKVMSFDSLNVFKPNEQTEDYHIRKPNDKNFEYKVYKSVGE